MKIYFAATLFFFILTGLITPDNILADREDIKNLANTKISLSEAIATAETKHDGRAVEAGLDDDSFKLAYKVEVVVNDKLFEVLVDAVTGEIIGSREELDD